MPFQILLGDFLNRNLFDFQWQIGLGQTLCYQFKSPGNSDHGGLIEVSFRSMRSVYAIANSYFFKLAKTNLGCFCDCPGGANHCNTFTDRCGNKPNCHNVFMTDTQSSGCFLKFLKLSSAVCCTVEVVPEGDQQYRALELSVPSMLAQFQVSHRDHLGNLLDRRTISVDLNSGVSVDWAVGLMVSSPGPKASVPPGWYFSAEGLQQDLFGNVPVNGLNEWNVQKLGWFKSQHRRMDLFESRSRHQPHLVSPIIEDCASNTFKATFATEFVNENQLKSARSLKQLHSFIKEIQVWNRHVEVVHRESPLLVLTLQHQKEVDVLLKTEQSYLFNFEGVLHLDSNSNQFLNLTLYKVRGVIHGQVQGFNSTLAIQITMGSEHVEVSHQRIKTSGLICHRAQVSLSLRARGQTDGALQKHLPCAQTGLNAFGKTQRSLQLKTYGPFGFGGTSGIGSEEINDCVLCLEFLGDIFAFSFTHWQLALFCLVVIVMLSSVIVCCLRWCLCCCC
ncbi:hypothetical protein TCAL_00601 [Tigriopus californicus]|uniref:Uncharacterized protein n=1 Tax=Tigriopus californicus TaxID=6832 RepID=A0A553PBN4_TIGCA|nr:hypothetical protein TCAL_00601 [Tigriopus californicus]|eukprot:TCALIF_00601-PA protein Name:"Protein of unknown function" AED:0.37 eAED:0.37 QI:0/0.6/0.33/0.66/0.6/0.83/6/0/503